MNSYQKAAVLAVRIVAAYFIATSFLAFGVELLDRAMSNRPTTAPFTFMTTARPLVANAIHVVFGLLLWLYAKPLGRWLGKGLD